MNTCGTCRFFGEALTEWSYDAMDMVPTGFHSCDLLNLKRKEQKIPPPLAYAQDGSDYQAVLCVKGEFGCVEWQSVKPAPKP